jgi:hypothetical protein
MACKATLKVESVLDQAQEEIAEIGQNTSSEGHSEGSDDGNFDILDEKQAKREVTKVYFKTGMAFVKLYGPSVVLMTLSIGSMVGSNYILKRRNAQLAAAYTSLQAAFNRYRANVVEKYGENVDYDMRYGRKTEKIETVDDNGKTKTEKVDVVDPDVLLDSNSVFLCKKTCGSYWDDNKEYMLNQLKCSEYTLDRKLKRRGYLFTNSIREELNLPLIPEGQAVGYLFDLRNDSLHNEFKFNSSSFDYIYTMIDGEMTKGLLVSFEPDGVITYGAFDHSDKVKEAVEIEQK